MKSDKIIEEILFEIEKHEGGMSRRNAMKLLATSPIAASVLASAATATEAHAASSNATGKIVIVGGGLAGVATAAKLDTVGLSNPNITTYRAKSQISFVSTGANIDRSGCLG